MPNVGVGGDQVWETGAFVELRENLAYARDLVQGGQHLERLQVGAFDVADLYRAAWVQAVSALDHWVHRELYVRALAFATTPSAPQPAKFLLLKIPMGLFQEVHDHDQPLEAALGPFLREHFGYQSFQAPAKIKEALAHVSDVQLWPAVAKWLTTESGQPVGQKQVPDTLGEIVVRRNHIAHEADRDPKRPNLKRPISGREASEVIDYIERLATAILRVIGPAPLSEEQADDQPSTKVVGAARAELYREFWTRFVRVLRDRGWADAAPPAQNWWSLPAGVGGVSWSVSFTRFGCRSELVFEHPDPATNQLRWQALADRRQEIEAHFGRELLFDDLPNRKACRIEVRLIGPTITDRDHWTDVLRWMEDSQVGLRSAVAAAGGVPTMTAG